MQKTKEINDKNCETLNSWLRPTHRLTVLTRREREREREKERDTEIQRDRDCVMKGSARKMDYRQTDGPDYGGPESYYVESNNQFYC